MPNAPVCDVFLSHDLEDIMTVVEGRLNLVAEVEAAADLVRQHIARSVVGLLGLPAFANALPGLLSDPEQEISVLARLGRIAQFI